MSMHIRGLGSLRNDMGTGGPTSGAETPRARKQSTRRLYERDVVQQTIDGVGQLRKGVVGGGPAPTHKKVAKVAQARVSDEQKRDDILVQIERISSSIKSSIRDTKSRVSGGGSVPSTAKGGGTRGGDTAV